MKGVVYVSKKRKSSRPWKLAGRKNKHHIKNKIFGGTWAKENIIEWDVRVHEAWHFIFGHMTLLEAAEWLVYVDEQKKLGIDTDLQK